MITNFFFINEFILLNNLIISIFFFIFISCFFIIFLKDTIHVIFYFMFVCLYLTELCILLKMEFLALNFIIIYLGAICVLILFQVKLVRLLVEKNSNLYLNNILFLPCLIIFIILPVLQFSSIFFLLTDSFIINLNLSTSLTTNLNSVKWINYLNTTNTLQILGLYIYKYKPIYLIVGSLILIIAMIGSIILTIEQKPKNSNYLNV